MSKGLALLEQSLLQYDEEMLRARLPLEPGAVLQKRDVHPLSMSPEVNCSPEMFKNDNDHVDRQFNTVIVKNDKERREGGLRHEGEDRGGEEEDESYDEESDEEEDEEEDDDSEEEEEPGCSSETKGLVFSSFESDDSDEWEPPVKKPSDEEKTAAAAAEMEKKKEEERNEQKHKDGQPYVIRRDIGSFVFHNCSLKENRNKRKKPIESRRERMKEKDKPGCSSDANTNSQNNTILPSADPKSDSTASKQYNSALCFKPDATALQPASIAPNFLNTDLPDPRKLTSKRKTAPENSTGEVGKTTKHKCNECGKYFQCEAHLQRHMLIHYGLKPFECPVCEKAFRYKSSYKAHLNMHTEEKPLSCSICHKGFTQSRDLKRHMLSHTDEKNFDCVQCGGKFKHKHNLIRHISVIHKAEKPYPCPMCDKAFAQKHDFMTHMRTHSGEKPFTCQVCTRSFGAKGTLRTHMKVHKKPGSKDETDDPSLETGEESTSDL